MRGALVLLVSSQPALALLRPPQKVDGGLQRGLDVAQGAVHVADLRGQGGGEGWQGSGGVETGHAQDGALFLGREQRPGPLRVSGFGGGAAGWLDERRRGRGHPFLVTHSSL